MSVRDDVRVVTDPVLSQIIFNYELTMNREMGRAVVNLSGSFLFVSASDFACGCLDADGNILTTTAWSLQMGYAISNTVKASLKRFEGRLFPGDVIFCNDPYDGGGLHSHDVVVVAPVFADDELLMWVGVCAHVTDVGGALAGGYSVEPMECFGENVRFSPVKMYDRGEFRADLLDAFLTNVRVPDQTGTDLKALMGAVWIGRERAHALIEHYGADVVLGVHAGQLRQSAKAFADRLASLPDGVYEGAAHMEHDGADDKIYTIRMRIIKEGSHATFDYDGTDAQAPGVLNCTYVGAVGNVMAALGTILAPDISFNEGLMWPVDINAPAGTLVNAIKPAPISGATVYAAWFGTDAILEAANYLIADATDLAHRRTGPWGCWTFAWLQATNQHGEPWFWNVFTGGSGGGGALPDRDGENAILGIQTIDAFTPNIEEYEIQSPVLFVSRGFARDSGGAGRFRGGLALESLCVPYQCEGWDVTVFHNRLTAPSSSVAGGYPGSGSAIEFARGIRPSLESSWRAGGVAAAADYQAQTELLPTRGTGLRLRSDDGYYMRATGGPGHGDPIDRPAQAVVHDVRRGFVSAAMAAEVYGIVLDDAGTGADEQATETRRAAIREARQHLPLGAQVLPEAAAAADPGPVEPRREQVLSDYLGIDATGLYRCRRCGFTYCSNALNWKWFARCDQAPVGPDTIKNTVRVRSQQDLVVRVYVCPGCATQVDLEIALRDEPARWNYRPLALWQRRSRAGQP